MPARFETGLSPLTIQRGYALSNGLVTLNRIHFPNWDANLSLYDKASELALYGALNSQIDCILPASPDLPEPGKLSQRSLGLNVEGLRAAVRTQDVVVPKKWTPRL
jgi:hypothetical protein